MAPVYSTARGSVSAAASPGGRADACAAVDPVSGVAWLMGGTDTAGVDFGDVWALSPSSLLWSWTAGRNVSLQSGFAAIYVAGETVRALAAGVALDRAQSPHGKIGLRKLVDIEQHRWCSYFVFFDLVLVGGATMRSMCLEAESRVSVNPTTCQSRALLVS
jgi:hypothetical protein